jgi:hypothetical protein
MRFEFEFVANLLTNRARHKRGPKRAMKNAESLFVGINR